MPAPHFPLVLTVLSWGFNFIAMKLLYREIPPAAVGLVRYLLMWACVAGVCTVLGESLRYPPGKTRPILIQGFVSMGLYMVLFFEGINLTSAAEGAIILATAPVLTAIFAIVLKQETLRWGALVGAVVALAGVSMVVLGGAVATPPKELQQKLLGDGLILLSACVWAANAVMSRPLMAEISPWRLLALGMPAAALILVPYGAGATLAVDFRVLTPEAWGYIAHVTLLAGLVGFAGFYSGIKKLGASRTLLYQFFVPPMAAFFEWWLTGKSLKPIQFVGLAVVILGVWLASRARAVNEHNPDAAKA